MPPLGAEQGCVGGRPAPVVHISWSERLVLMKAASPVWITLRTFELALCCAHGYPQSECDHPEPGTDVTEALLYSPVITAVIQLTSKLQLATYLAYRSDKSMC
jgi:hypothetical protein